MARVLRRVLLRHPNTTRRLLLAQGLGDLLPVHLGERVAHDLGAAARLAGVLLFVLVEVFHIKRLEHLDYTVRLTSQAA